MALHLHPSYVCEVGVGSALQPLPVREVGILPKWVIRDWSLITGRRGGGYKKRGGGGHEKELPLKKKGGGRKKF